MADLMQLNKRLSQTAATAEKRGQFLAFTLGGEMFAMDIRSIKEVIQFVSLTEVPLVPDFIRGVINLRGSVVPVIDISVRFGRTVTEIGRRTCIVIVEVDYNEESSVLGILVDSVSEVLEIGESEIEPAPSFGSSLRADFIAGVGKVNGKFIIILSVNRVLSVDEMASIGVSHDTNE
jgi:purine-binding chemotaxis protein CheW